MEINASLVIWWDNTSARQPHVHVHELLALWEQECWTLTSVLASIIRSHHSFASNYANSGWRDDQRCLLPNEGWYPLILLSSPILPLVIIHPSIVMRWNALMVYIFINSSTYFYFVGEFFGRIVWKEFNHSVGMMDAWMWCGVCSAAGWDFPPFVGKNKK